MKYSGVQVNRAGRKLLQDNLIENEAEFSAVLDVISYWRSEHDAPLKRAFEALQRVALEKDRRAIFAKRLKRVVSIARKLERFESMDLKNMQDIGGCRAIITNHKKLQQTLRELKHLPEFRWADGGFRIKDYIENPKADGYRSVHIIGSFLGDIGARRRIEVQLRTYIQHYWATALEIVDLFTDQALKSNQGDKEWAVFFQNVSEHFALMDDVHIFATMPPRAKLAAYRKRVQGDARLLETAKLIRKCAKNLRVVDKLGAFAGSLVVVDKQITKSNEAGFVLLKINIEKTSVETQVFLSKDSKQAEAAYISLESRTAKVEGVVVALVSSTAVGGIKEAYPNYFADSTNFFNHLSLILEV